MGHAFVAAQVSDENRELACSACNGGGRLVHNTGCGAGFTVLLVLVWRLFLTDAFLAAMGFFAIVWVVVAAADVQAARATAKAMRECFMRVTP